MITQEQIDLIGKGVYFHEGTPMIFFGKLEGFNINQNGAYANVWVERFHKSFPVSIDYISLFPEEVVENLVKNFENSLNDSIREQELKGEVTLTIKSKGDYKPKERTKGVKHNVTQRVVEKPYNRLGRDTWKAIINDITAGLYTEKEASERHGVGFSTVQAKKRAYFLGKL